MTFDRSFYQIGRIISERYAPLCEGQNETPLAHFAVSFSILNVVSGNKTVSGEQRGIEMSIQLLQYVSRLEA